MSQQAFPLPSLAVQKFKFLTPWISGETKPIRNGLYLRDFLEGSAVSEFRDGQWLFDGFFASNIQNARWRGLKESPQAGLAQK